MISIKKPPLVKVCEKCQKEFLVKNSVQGNGRKYCSRSCSSRVIGLGRKMSEKTKIKLLQSKAKKVESICLNCGIKILAQPSRKKKYCSRVCYRVNSNKPGGFKKGGPTLYEKWVTKYGEEVANIKEANKNKKISAVHLSNVSVLSREQRIKRFAGRPNATKGVSQLQRMINKYGHELGLAKYKISLKRLSDAGKRPCTPETREKIRISRIKGIEARIKKPLSPRYNPSACRFIEAFGKDQGYNFIHAESPGGEHRVNIGFYLDGYDATNNTVIEYYEKFHFDGLGNLKQREQLREIAIIKHLNCTFFRVNAFDINDIKIEKVA